MSYSSEVLADAPIGYWKLDETSGSTINDSSGNARHGTYSGATLGEVPLHAGSTAAAKSSTSTGQGIGSIPGGSWANLGTSFTLECWAKINTVQDVPALFSRWDGNGFIVWQRTGRYELYAEPGGIRYASKPLVATEVSHLAFVADGTNLTAYVNGFPYARYARTADLSDPSSGTAVQIGGYNGSNRTDATISDVAIYDYALSAARIRAHYGATVTATAPDAISGLVGNFDAQAITGLADNDTVTSWDNTVSGGVDLAAGTGAPKYKTGIIAGHPVVRFTRSATDMLAAASIMSSRATYTLVLVGAVRNNVSSFQAPAAVLPAATITGGLAPIIQTGSSPGHGLYLIGSYAEYDAGAYVLGSSARWVVRADANMQTMHRDGALTKSRIGSTTANATRLTVGGATSDGLSDVDVAHVLLYDRPLTPQEIVNLDAWLEQHWSATTTGTGSATLPVLTATGAGVNPATGTGAATLPALTATGSGTNTTTGTGAATLPALTADGEGTVTDAILGDGEATLPALTGEGTGVATTTGTGAADLPSLTATGAGIVTFTATGAATGPAGIADGDGDNGDAGATGVGAATGPAGVAAGAGDNSVSAPRSLTMSAGLTLNLTGGVYKPGSLYNAILLTTPPQAVDFADFTSSPEPAPEDGDAAAVDAWYRYESAGSDTVTLTWTGGFSVGLEVWIVSLDDVFADIDEATLVGSGVGPTLVFSAGEGQAYLIRVHPMDDANNAGTGSLSWATVARPASGLLGLEVGPVIYDTPAWLEASVLSATPDGDVEFEIDTVLVLTTTADDAGTLAVVAIPAGVLLTVGTHTLLARDVTTGIEDSLTFDVESLTAEPDADPPSAGPATPATGDVIRWVFELPAPSAMTYTFEHNPTEMTSPFSRRVLNPEHTTAPDGQPVIFEGQPVAVEWSATGVVFTQAHYDALEQWHALNRRFYAIDHHERAWLVTLEDVSWTEMRDPSRPWAHRYSLKFLIWDGPYELEEP